MISKLLSYLSTFCILIWLVEYEPKTYEALLILVSLAFIAASALTFEEEQK